MYCKNKYASLSVKLIAACLCLFGQIAMYFISQRSMGIYLYYTNMSNILCFVYFVLAAVHCIRQFRLPQQETTTFAPRLRGAAVMAITVTMLVYWFVLNSSGFVMDGTGSAAPDVFFSVSNYVVHLIVPLLMIADWLIFDKKGLYKTYDPLLWLAIPLVYYVLSIVIAQTSYRFHGDTRYPYFFIDPDIIGYGGVAMFVAGMVAAFLLLGYLILGADRLLRKKG